MHVATKSNQPAGWGGFLALLTVLSSPVRVGRLAMLSVSDKSLSQDEEALERRENPSAFRRRESQISCTSGQSACNDYGTHGPEDGAHPTPHSTWAQKWRAT
ncbi:MAG TPA: hypothetical protein VHZ51_05495, partial [Ktedonobacteraceae bacterium]|nr:hypothetical protein [Ktedonobacteraceae bacterium]